MFTDGVDINSANAYNKFVAYLRDSETSFERPSASGKSRNGKKRFRFKTNLRLIRDERNNADQSMLNVGTNFRVQSA